MPQLRQTSQQIPLGTLKLGWPFRVVLNLSRGQAFVLTYLLVIRCRLLLERGCNLGGVSKLPNRTRPGEGLSHA